MAVLLLSVFAVATAQQYPDASVLASGTWYKVGIEAEGVYRIDASQLPALAGTRADGVAVYGLEGGMMSEYNSSTTLNDLRPVAVSVTDANANGLFDADDYLLFYGEGPSVWRYNSRSARYHYQRHAYATANYYYVSTVASAAPHVEPYTTATVATAQADSYTAVAVHDDDLVNAYGSGRIFVGERFSAGLSSRTITLQLSDSPVGTVSARMGFATLDAVPTPLSLSLFDQTADFSLSYGNTYTTVSHSFSVATASAMLPFVVTYSPASTQPSGYLDFLEVNAPLPLRYRGGQQSFRFAPAQEATALPVSGLTPSLHLWDVTNPLTPRTVAASAAAVADSGVAAHLVAFSLADVYRPATVAPIVNQNLHALVDIDYLIVTHPAYAEQAEQIAQMHRVADMMNVSVVTDEQVFNEFSSGKQDPMAVRSLLRMLWQRSQASASVRPPRYLLLFGKGSYDNRDLEQRGETTVVTYESEDSFTESSSYGSDDLFGFLDLGETGTNAYDDLDIGIGRLPARSIDEADHYVDKLRRYMERSDRSDASIRGDWRTYVALIADDADPSSPGDTLFAHSAEDLALRIKAAHPRLNIDRIYADAFVQQSGAIGSFYPDVNNAIKKRLDYGCLLLNYIGHGSMQYIGTERYISLTDVDGYANADQLTFFVTSTCTYGKYDQPGGTCGAEAFLNARGGAVGCISASRPIYHIEQFNSELCSLLLSQSNTVGDALRTAKNHTLVSPSISLLGDPALHLSLPQNEVRITAVNQHAVADSLAPDTASALSTVVVSGVIVDEQGELIDDFDGTLFSTVFDRETITHTLANDNPGTEVAFRQQKNVLYRGSAPVSGGRFEYSFTVPRDISYSYAAGRLSHYASSPYADAAGNFERIVFGGFDTTASYPVVRPQLRLFIGDTNFRSGGIANASPLVLAFLSDSVGINAVGSGIGHDITLTLDDNPAIVVNDFYEQDIDDARRGTLSYAFANLSAGKHTLTLKAWNIYNYSNSATITFTVGADDELLTSHLSAYPNPAADAVMLRLDHNKPGAIASATLTIFDHQGSVVFTDQILANEGSCVIGPYRWPFRSSSGATLHAGLYLARLTLTSTNGSQSSHTTKIVKIQ